MTDAELVSLEARAMKLIARSEALRVQAEDLDHQLDEIQLCMEIQDTLVGSVDEPIWLPLLRSAYADLQGG